MPWTLAFSFWSRISPQLCRDFPHLDPAAIRRFRGNISALIEYLANTHELTLSEASEVLRDWLAFRAASIVSNAA